MVELIFIGRNSGGVVNSLEVKDVGSYGTNNVSIGITVQHNTTILYQDSIDTYSISKGGSIVISAPYDDNGIKTGTYYTRFRVRNDDTLDMRGLLPWVSRSFIFVECVMIVQVVHDFGELDRWLATAKFNVYI